MKDRQEQTSNSIMGSCFVLVSSSLEGKHPALLHGAQAIGQLLCSLQISSEF